MDVILLEKIGNLGDLGDKVTVKPGFGRNFLIPQGKAVPATRENVEKFEARRAELVAAAEELLAAAEVRAVERAVYSIIVSRCLERCADLATNVAEAVVFIVEGVDIKHHCKP